MLVDRRHFLLFHLNRCGYPPGGVIFLVPLWFPWWFYKKKRTFYLTHFIRVPDFDLTSHQSSQNIIRVKSSDEVSFTILYEESPTDEFDLNDEKFLHQATVVLDLGGSSVRNMSTVLLSPNYPYNYPDSALVTWLVQASGHYAILMTVTDIAIEECCDRLILYDGSSSQSPVLSVLTGSNFRNKAITSSSNNLFIRFSSDCSVTDRGFEAMLSPVSTKNETTPETTTFASRETSSSSSGGSGSYETTSSSTGSQETCGGLQHYQISILNSYFSSPGYPFEVYPNNLNCEWRLESLYSGYVIRLDVLELELEYCGIGCDYLDVFDGYSSSDPLLARLTGVNQNDFSSIFSTGQYMYLNFRTDGSIALNGYRLRAVATPPQTRATTVPYYTTRLATTAATTTTTQSNTCGGLYNVEMDPYARYIYSPEYPYYPNNANCEWRLHTMYYGYVIQLRVIEIDLESCCDYVDVYDGDSSFSYWLVRLQSTSDIGRDILSTGQWMYLNFRSDYSVTRRGFQFRVSAISSHAMTGTTVQPDQSTTPEPQMKTTESLNGDLLCSSPQYADVYPYSNFSVFSPGYHDSYPNNLNCEWRLITEFSGFIIHLHVNDLDLTSCCDYVEVFDVYPTHFLQIAHLSSRNEVGRDIYSSGQSMYLYFRSDFRLSGRGFWFQVSAISPYDPSANTTDQTGQSTIPETTAQSPTSNSFSCSNLKEVRIDPYSSSYILSPGYPNNFYQNNLNCAWRLQTDLSGFILQLQVLDLELESYADYVDVYDGESSNFIRIARLSLRTDIGRNLFSSGQSMYLNFRSDSSITRKGFQFRVVAILSFNPTGTTDQPGPSIEPEITTGQPPIFTEATTAQLPGSNVSCNGFRNLYVYPDSSFYLSSPGYSYEPYPNNQNCEWRLTSFFGFIIQISVFDIDLELCCDYVDVFDGFSSSSFRLARLPSNADTGKNIVSTAQWMFLRFHTDASVAYRGFRLLLSSATSFGSNSTTYVPDRTTRPLTTPQGPNSNFSCSLEYIDIHANSNRYISSPDYPNFPYPNLFNCQWGFRAYDSGHVIQIDILDLELEYCSYGCDYVDVFNGANSTYPKLARLSRINMVNSSTIVSTGQYIYLFFKTDGSITRKGFHFRISATASSTVEPDLTTTQATTINPYCNELVTIFVYDYSTSGSYVFSPLYPNSYPNNLNCEWRLQAESSRFIIRLHVDDIQIQSCCDYLDAFDGLDQSNKIARLSSTNDTGREILSTGRWMNLNFVTDSSISDKGFQLRATLIETACPDGSFLYADFSRSNNLSSAGYPNLYGNSLDCTWTAIAFYENYVIELTVLDIDLETCCDYVDVHDGFSGSFPRIIRLTDQQNEVVYSTGPSMYIRFRTDGSVSGKGFQFSYIAVIPSTATTGFEIVEPTNETLPETQTAGTVCQYPNLYAYHTRPYLLTSPGYPDSHPANLRCHWAIKASIPYYTVQLSIIDIDLNYPYDEIQIYDGLDSSGLLLRSLTINVRYIVYSTTDEMFITFRTEFANSYRGFQAAYSSIYQQNCFNPDAP